MATPKKIKEDDEKRICYLYEIEKKNTIEIGKLYNCTYKTITNVLKRNGVKLKDTRIKKIITGQQEKDFCQRYLNGESTISISKSYNLSDETIRRVLIRNNIKRRKKNIIKKQYHKAIGEEYINGSTLQIIAEKYNSNIDSVARLLEKLGIKRRTQIEIKEGVPKDKYQELIQLYKRGLNWKELGEKYKVRDTTIGRILKNCGVKTRSVSEAKGGLNEKQIKEVCDLYLEGYSSLYLSEEYGIHKSTILDYLERNNIERRSVGSFYGDSIQDVLNETGHHKKIIKTCFYIYGINGFPDFFKPGIAFSMDERIRNGEGIYGEEYFYKQYESRKEAYVFEQALLKETLEFAKAPQQLIDIQWDGVNEIRCINLDKLLEITLFFEKELEEVGLWEFATRYVPMTAKEKKECLIRLNS